MVINKWLYCLCVIFILTGCKQSTVVSLPTKIIIPESLELHSFDYQGRFGGKEDKFKLVASYDSLMCGVCSIKRLIAWREMIEYAESTDDMSIMLIFSPNSEDRSKMIEMIDSNPIDYPIYFDPDNKFAYYNDLPRGLFVCLLDENDSILITGNPFIDDRWDTYKTVISNYHQQ